MGLARTWSITLTGIIGQLVEVEADLAPGLPGCTLVGLPDAALSEARDRIRAAILNSGESWPSRRITLGLSPADLPKHGSRLDVAMAVAILAAAGAVPAAPVAEMVFLGELGLDGGLRPTRGVLPAVLAASAAGRRRVVVPAANAREARLVPDVEIWAAARLGDLLTALRDGRPPPDDPGAGGSADTDVPASAAMTAPHGDLADVLGQPTGRRAIEVAAAGGHHLFLVGDPGTGKTMLASRLPSLLPDLSHAEALEVTAVYSVAGALPAETPIIKRPPFRDPHHSTSVAALIGGGSGLARPGQVSLAHRGVLFLDEAPEFSPTVLDALRQPLESGRVTIARSGGTTSYPARFLLVLAANPCPCAAAGRNRECTCSPMMRRRYLSRLSGPLLDRVDLQVRMDPVSRAELLADRRHTEPGAVVAKRVALAQQRAAERWSGTPWRTNAEIPGPYLRSQWPLSRSALAGVERALDTGFLSARGLDRVLRVAWTLADLADVDRPGREHVDEALYLRTGIPA